MGWQYNAYVPPLVAAAAVSAALALFVWRRRPAPGTVPFVWLMLAVTEWSLGYALELGSTDLPGKLFWAKVQYLGIVFVPLAWLVFALQYAGRDKWLARRNLIWLSSVPCFTLLLVWTNDVHGLIWSSVKLDNSGLFPMLDLTYGAWWWVNFVYSYLLLLLSTFLLVQMLVRSPHLYRGQAGALLIGALAPWVGNVLYVSGLSPLPCLDLTPFAFTLTGLAVAWGLFHFQLLEIVPVARDAVIESMGDAVIVLDMQDRVADLNPAAQRLLDHADSEIIGQPAAQVLSDWSDGSTELAEVLVEQYRDVRDVHSEIVLGEDGAQRTFDLRISPLYDRRGRFTGRLVVARDITERKQAERRLGVFYEVATAVMTSVRLDEILNHTLSALQKTLRTDDIAILLVEPGARGTANELVIRAHSGFPGGPKLKRRRIGVGIPGWVVQTGQPVLLDDVYEDERYHGCDPDTRSELCVPLQVGGRVTGAINLESRRLAAFSEEDLHLLSILAVHLSTVIENARLFEETERLKVFNESIVQGMAEGLCIEDADGIITFVNPAMEELLGYGADELVGQHWRTTIVPDEIERVQEKTSQRLAGISEQYEARMRAKDGREIPVLLSARPLFEDGEFTGVLSAFTDMSERETLEGMWRRYEFIVNASREFMILIGRNGVYEAANEAYCKTHNKTREEIIGKTVVEVWGEDVYSANVKECLDKCFDGEIVHYTAWFDFSTLGPRCMDVTYYPYYGGAGNVTHAVVVSRDTTERQRAEDALCERTAQLESTNKELEAFAYSVSHDLRAPLRSIDGFSQILLEDYTDKLDAEGQDYLRRVRVASQRMAHLIEDLLTLSRITRREMRREPVDLSALAREIVAELKQREPDRQVEFVIEEEVTADGDAGLLRVVLENLLGNAWKFTARHPRASIEFGVTQRDGETAYFVRDDGAGFDMAHADKLFGTFQRLHSAAEFEGTGIGLATVQRIIHRHGGRVWADGAVEQGATFYFTL